MQLAAANLEKGYAFAYLDFNHFEPFNDTSGFHAGDLAILLFTDLLKQEFLEPGHFIGHVGRKESADHLVVFTAGEPPSGPAA